MATRANVTSSPAVEQSAPVHQSVPALARANTGPSLGSTPLRLEPGRGLWTWAINPAKLGCRDGRIVPLQVPVLHAGGFSANIEGDQGAGWLAQLRREGWVEIPHDFAPDAKAFDQPRTNAALSVYIEEYRGVAITGVSVTRYVDAWKRPLQIGMHTEWEEDTAGRDAYLARALVEIANKGQALNEAQIRLATRPYIRQIEALASRDDARAVRHISQIAGHLPVQYHTEGVREILKRHGIETRTE